MRDKRNGRRVRDRRCRRRVKERRNRTSAYLESGGGGQARGISGPPSGRAGGWGDQEAQPGVQCVRHRRRCAQIQAQAHRRRRRGLWPGRAWALRAHSGRRRDCSRFPHRGPGPGKEARCCVADGVHQRGGGGGGGGGGGQQCGGLGRGHCGSGARRCDRKLGSYSCLQATRVRYVDGDSSALHCNQYSHRRHLQLPPLLIRQGRRGALDMGNSGT